MTTMLRKLLGFVLLACASFAIGQEVDPTAEQQMVQMVNAERATKGLRPLEIDERLTRIAREHSKKQATKGTLSHQFPGEPDVRHRVTSTGLRFSMSGENVAYDADAPSAHRSLMSSPPHRANILRPEFNAVGIGLIRKGNQVYVTQDFAHRTEEFSASQFETEVANTFATLRRSNSLPPLPLRPQNGLRDIACDMARNDRLETDLARDIANVRTVVVWTATEPQKLPDSMLKMRNTKASAWSLGSCFASSARYPNPVWWNVAVTYF